MCISDVLSFVMCNPAHIHTSLQFTLHLHFVGHSYLYTHTHHTALLHRVACLFFQLHLLMNIFAIHIILIAIILSINFAIEVSIFVYSDEYTYKHYCYASKNYDSNIFTDEIRYCSTLAILLLNNIAT